MKTELDKLADTMRELHYYYRMKETTSDAADDILMNKTRAELLEILLQEVAFIRTEKPMESLEGVDNDTGC